MAILDGYFLDSTMDLGSADLLALDILLESEDENQSLDSALATRRPNTSGILPASDQPSDGRSDTDIPTVDTSGFTNLEQATKPCASSNNL